jgi:hypothetical protein
MNDAEKKREQAKRYRDLADAADNGTAANLRMLASDCEEEADSLEADQPPLDPDPE